MTSSRAGILKDIIFSPKNAFSEIGENEKKYFPIAFVIFFVTAISVPLLNSLGEVIKHYYFVDEIARLDYTSIFFEIEFGFIFGLGFIALIYWIGKKFGGKGSFKGVFSSLCYASLPISIIGVLILLPLIALVSKTEVESINDPERLEFYIIFNVMIIAQVGISIWGIILSVMATMKSHQIRIGKSIGVIIIAGIIIVVIAVPVFILSYFNDKIPNF